jgi:ankyrin repeat protein
LDPRWEYAVRQGDVHAVGELLRAGADVDARDRHGQTALMLAAHRGYRDVVEVLADAGADLNVAAKYNLTALMLAVVAGHATVARVLVRAGADLGIRGVGAPGFAGKTAYDLALAREMEELYADLAPGGGGASDGEAERRL